MTKTEFLLTISIQWLRIYESHIWTADKDVNESDPRSNVHYLAVVTIRPEKNSGLYGIWTHDLFDTGVALYQLS